MSCSTTRSLIQYMLSWMSDCKRQEELEDEKQAAARAALAWVRPGMVLGLGTGTTARYFIGFLGDRIREEGLTVQAVASSLASEASAARAGINIIQPKRGLRLDLTVDGADEIAPNLDLIKGAGGALLREKALAHVSNRFVIVADSSKLVQRLGTAAVPVEVVSFTHPWTMDAIEQLGGEPVLRMDRTFASRPYATDQGNYILDVRFQTIADPDALAHHLKEITGVVEHGVFLHSAHKEGGMVALVASGDTVAVFNAGDAPAAFAP